jgi:hypothetical protein
MVERAYGPNIVRRVRYSDLLEKPEPTMRPLLNFLGELYTARCLEPLSERINSSNVPDDCKGDVTTIDPAVVEQATRLDRDLEETGQPAEVSCAVADEMETAFLRRIQYIATLESQYQRALQTVRKLENPKAPEVRPLKTSLAHATTSIRKV